MISSLESILGNPASNPQVIAIVVAIVIAAVLFVAFVLIGLALPRPSDLSAKADEKRRSARRTEAGCGIAIVITAFGLAVATTVWYATTSSNTYCTRTCHQMAGPAASWAASAHDQVPCMRCHVGTGWRAVPTGIALRVSCLVSAATGQRTKSFPVPDSRCLECHSAVLDATMKARNGEPFTHRDVLALGDGCASCHGVQGHVAPRSTR